MSAARLSQASIEVLALPTPAAKVSQAVVEILSGYPIEKARVSQVAVEVLSYRSEFASDITTQNLIFVAAITGAINADGDTETWYATNSHGWTTPPLDTIDTVPDAHIVPSLRNPGTYRREMFSGSRAFGAIRPAFGEVVLVNLDGRYDAWKDYGFDGQPFTLYAGEHGAMFPAAFAVVFKCVLESAIIDFDQVRLKLRDRLVMLDKPVLTDTYAGTGGVEGEEGMEGVYKWRMFGDPLYTPVQPIIMIPEEVRYNVTRQLYDLGGMYLGRPLGSETIFHYKFPRSVTFDASTMSPSKGKAVTAATSSAVFSIKKNDVQVATMTWSGGGTVPTFAMSSDTEFDVDDILTIVSPATADVTLADLAYTLSGYVN